MTQSTNSTQKKNAIINIDGFKKALTQTLSYGIKSIPKTINSERLKINAIIAITQNEFLANAVNKNPVKAAQMVYNFTIQGLDMLNKEAYLVPYKDDLTPIIDYKGLKKIAIQYSVKPIKIIRNGLVRENDEYSFVDDVFTHNYNPFATDKDRGKRIGAYCEITYQDETKHIAFVNEDEIKKVKGVSKSASSSFSPWQNWEDSMWEKTAVRKAMKNVQLDFGSNNALQQAYYKSDEDLDFNNLSVRKNNDEVVTQNDVLEAEVEIKNVNFDEIG